MLGLQSAPAYRALLRLAYLWDEVKAKRGSLNNTATGCRFVAVVVAGVAL